MKIEKIHNLDVAINCEWKTIDGGNLSSIKRKLKNNILNKDVDSFNAAVMHINKKSKTSYTMTTTNKRVEKENIIPLAAFFTYDFKGHIVVLKVKDYKENAVQHTLYWLCVIDTKGIILEDLILNEDYIDGKVSEYLDISYELAVFKNDYTPISDSIQVNKVFTEEVFDIDDVDYENLSFNFYKKEDYTKYYKIGFLFVLLLSGSMIFLSTYDTEDKLNLLQEDFTRHLSEEKRQIDNWLSAQPSSNKGDRSRGRQSSSVSYTMEESYDLAKKQIQDEFNQRAYSNINIVNNIIDIENSMPNYLAEWMMGNIVFLDNDFYIMYNKIPSSNGVFTELDMILKRYNNYVPFEIIPLTLNQDATIRTLGIDFSNKIIRPRDTDTGLTLFELREEQRSKVDEIMREISNIERGINRKRSSANNVSTFNQIVSNQINRIRLEIQSDVSRLNNLYEDVIEEISVDFDGFELDFSISKNTVINYIEIKHLNSTFEWSMPSKTKDYPDIGGLDYYYATSYDIEVSSISNVSNNFIMLVDAAEQLTEINSVIKHVEYNITSGDWVIEAVIYERK